MRLNKRRTGKEVLYTMRQIYRPPMAKGRIRGLFDTLSWELWFLTNCIRQGAIGQATALPE
jgi:hypothetical protein